MNVLLLEPYYGGSHKDFVDKWMALSCHDFTLLTLPPYKWKWRMRHSAIFFADQLGQSSKISGRLSEMSAGATLASGRLIKTVCENEKPSREIMTDYDVLFCSDMLNLAEFAALAPKKIANLKKIVYFHENQLTYPVRFEAERDYQFVMTNVTTCLAADEVWFNSKYHRDEFCAKLKTFFAKMPDFQPIEAITKIMKKTSIHPPGLSDINIKNDNKKQKKIPLVLWSARWEHDKNPELFFKALKIVKDGGTEFKLAVTGESFRDQPEIFKWAEKYFSDEIQNWGYIESQKKYYELLTNCDFVVSTADHEFFGIAVAQAISAGAFAVLPNKLSYPEIIGLDKNKEAKDFFYGQTEKELALKLIELIGRYRNQKLWTESLKKIATSINRFKWKLVAEKMDRALEGGRDEQ